MGDIGSGDCERLLSEIDVYVKGGFVDPELLVRLSNFVSKAHQENNTLKRDIRRLYTERSAAEENVHVLEGQNRLCLMIIGTLTFIMGYFCL